MHDSRNPQCSVCGNKADPSLVSVSTETRTKHYCSEGCKAKVIRELSKNPNVRQPYSDVQEELQLFVGGLTDSLLDKCNPLLTDDERSRLTTEMMLANQALLRARAVLDPESLSDDEWALASEPTTKMAVRIRGE
jgi:hypothetical protein